jgi:hypothetical protein
MGKEKIIPRFMKRWEKYLQDDLALQKRLKKPFYYQEYYENPPALNGVATKDPVRLPPEELEGRELIEISIPDALATYCVKLKKGKLRIRKGKAKKPILSLEIPLDLFKKMLLTEERVAWTVLDERCKLNFDTQSWTYYEGLTIMEILVCAQELVDKDSEIAELVRQL